MIRKVLFCTLLISVTSISFKFGLGYLSNYKDVVYNPYRVFGLPPWTSMKKIRKKYNELVRKYHPDKSHKDTRKEFELIQQSYDIIKKSRKENEENEEEMSFSTVITETIRSILGVEIIFFAIYMLAYITYKFQMLIVEPLFYLIISFTIIDNIFPHWFKEDYYQYLISFVLGIGLYYFHKKNIRKLFIRSSDKKIN